MAIKLKLLDLGPRNFMEFQAKKKLENEILGPTAVVSVTNALSDGTKIGSHWPSQVSGPNKIEAYKEAEYEITNFKLYKNKSGLKAKEKKEEKEKALAEDKKAIRWLFYIKDVEIKDGKKNYIELTTPPDRTGKGKAKPKDDSETDFMDIVDVEERTKKIKAHAITYIKMQGDNPKEKTKLTVKFSKWLDGYTVYIESFRRVASIKPDEPYTAKTLVIAEPEILDGYWVNERKEKIDNKIVGYKDTVYMYLKTLGMKDKEVTTQLWEEGVTFMGSYQGNDDKLCMNENVAWKLEGRNNYKKMVIPDESTEEYKEQRKEVWEKDPLDIYFSLPEEKDTEGYKPKFGDLLKLTVEEQIVDAYFAKAVKKDKIKDGTVTNEKDAKKTAQQTVYERINDASLGSEVYFVAETTNMHGRHLTLKAFDNEELMAKDADTSISLLDKDGNQQYKIQNVKVDAQTGKAIAKVKLRPKSEEDYKKLKEKFKEDKKAKLFIGINYTDSGHIARYKKFLDDNEFEVKESLCYCLKMGLVDTPCSGNGKAITEKNYEKLSKDMGVEKNVFKAVAKVESGGKSSFISTNPNKSKILYERHKAYKHTKDKYGKAKADELMSKDSNLFNTSWGGYKGGNAEHTRLDDSEKLLEERGIPIMSCSWGKFQVLGEYYTHLYDSPEELEVAQNLCEIQQFRFFKTYLVDVAPSIKKAMKDKNWRKIARLYNGPKYEENDYHTKMENAYNEYNKE